MGRAAVRTAIQAAVQNADLPYVGTVFPARPEIADDEAYVTTMNGQAIEESENGSACIIVVNITDDPRNRMADSGRDAVYDWWKHRIVLELFFASTGGDGLAAQGDYDEIVDALQILIRGNPTLSAPATIWSAGEYRYGVNHHQDVPYQSQDGLSILINGYVHFEAWEQPAGTAGQV